jgi:C1A family cysteine protease
MPLRIQRFGWRKDALDRRDIPFTPALKAEALPSFADLRMTPFMPPVYDQGELGSCTANAIASAMQFERRRQALADFTPSRLMIYYDERKLEGTIPSDAGAEIRDGIKSVAVTGVCPESEWPYDIEQFAAAPPAQAYSDALKDRAVGYRSIDNRDLAALKSCLAEGYPFVFGVTLFSAFDGVGFDGLVPMPAAGETPIGAHAMKAVGYSDASGALIVKNSWGTDWGCGGFCLMPYAYLTDADLADDFWTIRLVSP